MVDLGDMAQKRLSEANLTVQELLTIVDQIVTERLKELQQPAIADKEVWWESMVNEIIVPASSTPSATDMLREERDQ